MTLRRRLTAALALAVGVPLVVVAVVVTTVVPRLQEQGTADQLSVSAETAVNLLVQRCAALGDAARFVAAQAAPALAERGPVTEASGVGAALQEVTAGRVGAGAAVLAADGAVLARVGEVDAASAAGTSCARGELAERVPGLAESVDVAAPAPDGGDARTLGRAVVVEPLDTGEAERIQDATQARALVLLADGRPVAATVGPEAAVAVADAVARGGGAERVGEVGGWLYHRARAPELNMSVVALSPGQSSLGVTWVVLGLLLAGLAVAVAVSAVLARRLVGPLVAMTAAAERVGRGEPGVRVPQDGRDELARLGAAFNAMSADVAHALAEARAGRAASAESMRRFGAALARTHDMEGLLRTVLDTAVTTADGVAGWVHLGSRPGEPEVSRPPDGEAEAPVPDEVRRLVERARAERAPVQAPSAGPLGPALAVPLAHAEDILGVVTVARAPDAAPVDEAARQVLADLGLQAGTAVHNVITHEETQRLSVTDPLTGAGNVRYLSATLAREVERAARFDRPLSVLMLDLDHFKLVNDTWGHVRGDAVLREIARRLREAVREVDTVARYGGEEFALLLPETDRAGAEQVAARVVESVREDSVDNGAGGRLRVTVSVGVASFPEHGRTAGELLERADRALYAAKHGGRDRYVVAGTPDADAAPVPDGARRWGGQG